MKDRKKTVVGILAALAMLVIILDGKTALISMQEGIVLCFRTVIPALFPFFVLSGIISSSLFGRSVGLFRFLGMLCKIPKGSESLLAVGLLSGYPVGAQMVAQAHSEGKLSQSSARRMLGFCSNAGPSFLFGMLAPMFHEPVIPWLLWGVHITSALLVGWVLPGHTPDDCKIQNARPITLPQALQNAIRNMATVCGWVLVFRVILGFCDRWFFWLFPLELQVLLSGALELSNGCVLLSKIGSDGVRFVLASFMLSFGGLCVLMQTQSVTQGVGLGSYVPGKVLQTSFATVISCLLQRVIFPAEQAFYIATPIYIALIAGTFLVLCYLRRKKVVAFGRRMLYNTGS